MGEFPLYFRGLLINIVSLSWQPLIFSLSHLILTLLHLHVPQYDDTLTLTIVSHALILLEYFQQH